MSNLNDEDNQEKKVDSLKKEGEKELSTEEKLKEAEEKLLRTLAELENQRKRFDKEIKDAIDFGGFSFAKENLVILDNLQRAYISIKEDPVLKVNKDIDKFLNNIEVIENDNINSPSYEFIPQDCDLYIFPAWAEHYVESNLSNEDRISLSFDTVGE